MPEFILNISTTSRPLWEALGEFERGYIEAAFFTNGDSGDDDDHSLNNLGLARLTNAAIRKVAKDCREFQEENPFLLAEACECEGYGAEQAGRDFWFTRQGHGVGYWDREPLKDGVGDKLSDAARKFGECNGFYVQRGWIHAA